MDQNQLKVLEALQKSETTAENLKKMEQKYADLEKKHKEMIAKPLIDKKIFTATDLEKMDLEYINGLVDFLDKTDEYYKKQNTTIEGQPTVGLNITNKIDAPKKKSTSYGDYNPKTKSFDYS